MTTVRFPRSLYRPDAVTTAAELYAGLATIEVTTGADDIAAAIAPLEGAPAETVDAFCNHVLVETIRRERSAA